VFNHEVFLNIIHNAANRLPCFPRMSPVVKPSGPFYRQGFPCPAVANNEAVFEDLVEDFGAVIV
jgi:hypothetical protein